MKKQTRVVLLGPQRLRPTLRGVIDELGLDGPIAAITAGWEEREREDEELSDHLAGRTVNLEMYRRAEEVFQRDPELYEAMRERRDTMRELQEIYRMRLSYALAAARELMAKEGDAELLEPQRQEAIEVVRRLDEFHLKRLLEVHARFEEAHRPRERESVAEHRAELERLIDGACAVCVAGGHVAILINRLRMFGLRDLVGDRPLIAWSAGAMALSERIVAFHDSPPQGPGDAEVLDAGLGLCPGVVPLPHARRRLRLDDPTRVAIFARRFGPAACPALDQGTRLDWDGERWTVQPGTTCLSADGRVLEECAA